MYGEGALEGHDAKDRFIGRTQCKRQIHWKCTMQGEDALEVHNVRDRFIGRTQYKEEMDAWNNTGL